MFYKHRHVQPRDFCFFSSAGETSRPFLRCLKILTFNFSQQHRPFHTNHYAGPTSSTTNSHYFFTCGQHLRGGARSYSALKLPKLLHLMAVTRGNEFGSRPEAGVFCFGTPSLPSNLSLLSDGSLVSPFKACQLDNPHPDPTPRPLLHWTV